MEFVEKHVELFRERNKDASQLLTFAVLRVRVKFLVQQSRVEQGLSFLVPFRCGFRRMQYAVAGMDVRRGSTPRPTQSPAGGCSAKHFRLIS